MPLAHAVFFEEPREFTEDQIRELEVAGLLRTDVPVKPSAPAPAPTAPKGDAK